MTLENKYHEVRNKLDEFYALAIEQGVTVTKLKFKVKVLTYLNIFTAITLVIVYLWR